MAYNHEPFEQPFRTGRPYIILTNDLEEGGARHAGNVRRLLQPEDYSRPDDQLQIRPWVFPDMDDRQRRLIVEPEQQGQHDEHAEPETWDGQEENRHHARA